MASPEHHVPSIEVVTTIYHIADDLLQNILSRLPALSFASVSCVNRSWNRVCNRILCRPKLSSACLVHRHIEVAVDGVLNKILSEPIRPHFAILAVDSHLADAYRHITQRLGPNVPVIAKSACGFMGRDAVSGEFKESEQTTDVTIMLTAGYLPGIKVKKIPLLKQVDKAATWFVAETMAFSTSVSGCELPAAMIIFAEDQAQVTAIMKVMDRIMSSEMVIVGDYSCQFRPVDRDRRVDQYGAVALVFALDKNKSYDIGETRFHAVLSNAMLPLGHAYAVTFAEDDDTKTRLIARGSHENVDVGIGTLLHEAFKKRGSMRKGPIFIGLERVKRMMTFVFHKAFKPREEYICVDGTCIKTGDTIRVYYPDLTTGLCSDANVSNLLRCLKQESATVNAEVFGGLIFCSRFRGKQFYYQMNVESSPFLNNFPGVTFAGTFCDGVIGCGHMTQCKVKSQEFSHCCIIGCSAASLIMSYTPP